MNTDAVCELVKQIDGIDTNMLPQYTSTIKKVRLSMTFIVLVFLVVSTKPDRVKVMFPFHTLCETSIPHTVHSVLPCHLIVLFFGMIGSLSTAG